MSERIARVPAPEDAIQRMGILAGWALAGRSDKPQDSSPESTGPPVSDRTERLEKLMGQITEEVLNNLPQSKTTGGNNE